VHLRVAVLELAEDLLRALAHDVGQHVEPSAMGHAQHDLAGAVGAGFLDGQVQERNEALGAFQGETLGADELFLDELLEDDGVGEPGQIRNCSSRVRRQRFSVPSMRSCSQCRTPIWSMCMYCTPMERQ